MRGANGRGEGNRQNSCEFIEPPVSLKDKLGPGAGFSRQALGRAEKIAAAMQLELERQVIDWVRNFKREFTLMKLENAFDIPALISRGRELEQEGGGAGYLLIGTYAHSLVGFLRSLETIGGGEIGVIEAHLSALVAVVNEETKGPADRTAKALG